MEMNNTLSVSGTAYRLFEQVSHIESDLKEIRKLYEKAIADIPHTCRYCAKGQDKLFVNWRADEHCLACRKDRMCNWVWRGLEK